MSPLVIASITLACVLGGTLLGILLRLALPDHHLSSDSKDVVRLGMGLVATMAALVLGLLIASAKSSYDDQRNGLNQISVDLISLDTLLAEYGPDAQEVRATLRRMVATAIQRVWPEAPSKTSELDDPQTTATGKMLHSMMLELSPQDDRQRGIHAQALQIVGDLAHERWLIVAEQEGSSIPMPFLAILVFWLAVLFASFGLFGPPNATVITTLILSALSVSGAVFLTLELAGPFEGLLRVSDAPLRNAIDRLGQ